jgi:hypothetical protein
VAGLHAARCLRQRYYALVVRPITFWSLVAAAMFVAMTLLWVFGDEPTGFLLVLSSVLWWGSGLALIVFGLVAISRRGRTPAARGAPSPTTGPERSRQ